MLHTQLLLLFSSSQITLLRKTPSNLDQSQVDVEDHASRFTEKRLS